MKIVVTGAAGFIGSHLCEELLRQPQHEVIGIDAMIGPTPEGLKKMNLSQLANNERFQLVQANLLTIDLTQLLSGVDVIYHLAAIPGVRASWGKEFDPYVTNNILATQRLLEAATKHPSITKFIYASTSSVYGEVSGKVTEEATPAPLSPYGITKLTGEHLCEVHRKSYHVPTVVVRFFTVYGPRQRPDMAFHRFILAIIKGEPLNIYGDGTQSRDFTFVGDCVKATAAIMCKEDVIGKTFNIGGKERASINEVIAMMEEVTGLTANVQYSERLSGEPLHTWADISRAEQLLTYSPTVSLREGLVKEMEYIQSIYGVSR